MFEEHDTPRASSPVTPLGGHQSSSTRINLTSADKWAVLGDRRRGAYPTPSATTTRKRSRAGSWRARNIDSKTPKSPFSFVHDSHVGVLDHHPQDINAGRPAKSIAASASTAHTFTEHQHYPWLRSKDWRQHPTTPQRETTSAASILSGWRRGLHL
jgi:hypothetical protein